MPRAMLIVLVASLPFAGSALAANPAPCLKELQSLRHTEGAPGKGTTDTLAGGGAVRQDLRALYQAARVLAGRGDEEGCRIIVGRMRDISGQQPQPSQKVEHPGVGAALPINRLEGLVRAEAMIGAEVRNRADRVLGEVADVVIDPRDASVSYVLLARNPFAVPGDKVVAIPFHKLEATADRGLYVLDVPEDRVANAPAFPPDDLGQLAAQQPQIEAYWD